MKAIKHIIYIVCSLAALSSCVKLGGDENAEQEKFYTLKYVNQFAYNVMQTYYLWVDEIQDNLKDWRSDDDPIKKVKAVRYKNTKGDDIDKWTQVTSDYETFVSSIEGVSTTYGYEFGLSYTDTTKKYVAVVVKFVYAGSPAQKAGMKRGDVIIKVDGAAIPTASYTDIIKNKVMYSAHCQLGLVDGRTVQMDAVEMYCDPVHTVKVFDCGGKKVGYLHFTSFTLNAGPDLIRVCQDFKSQGVTELILDLRYNGGGYVQTEEVLASMLAPRAKVASGDIFMTEVYNKKITEAWGDEEAVTRFRQSFKINGTTYDTSESNVGISKIYAIMTGDSASASEALVCGLKPFLDVQIVGEQSYGKYCSGIILEGASWYETYKDAMSKSDCNNGKKYSANWGIYVMIGRYADRDGNTGCMPDGFEPDHYVADNPFDGCQLGDPEETMLKTALTLAGYEYPAKALPIKKKPAAVYGGPASPKREAFGVFLRQEPI